MMSSNGVVGTFSNGVSAINPVRGFQKAIAMVAVLCAATVSFAAAANPASNANSQQSNPQQIVERVTDALFDEVRALNGGKINESQYQARVKSTLDEVVNFPYIAAHVMGRAAYAGATAEQRQAFAAVFRDGLISSYSKGISGYADSDIKVAAVNADPKNAKRTTVVQEVSDKGVVHKLDYTMEQDKSGTWKVTNVTLNGVNLGLSFASQFKSSMRKYGNNLDQVIANWLGDA